MQCTITDVNAVPATWGLKCVLIGFISCSELIKIMLLVKSILSFKLCSTLKLKSSRCLHGVIELGSSWSVHEELTSAGVVYRRRWRNRFHNRSGTWRRSWRWTACLCHWRPAVWSRASLWSVRIIGLVLNLSILSISCVIHKRVTASFCCCIFLQVYCMLYGPQMRQFISYWQTYVTDLLHADSARNCHVYKLTENKGSHISKFL